MEKRRKVKLLGRAAITVLVLMALAAGMAGCGPAAGMEKETDERSYRRGKSLLREGRHDEALQAFLTVIVARPDAVESHLEAGLLYLNQIKDPLAAIYHFRSFLALSPEGEHAGFVRELILTAQKDFAQTLPGNPFADTVERVNLMEMVKALQAENAELKQEVLLLRRQLTEQERELARLREAQARRGAERTAPAEVAPIVIQQRPEPVTAGQPAPARTYTVQAGDTLSRISSRVYGETARWTEIFEANRDQLPSPNALQPGQVLRIP
jgi:tetratricopeptide (TPR) repeat protein